MNKLLPIILIIFVLGLNNASAYINKSGDIYSDQTWSGTIYISSTVTIESGHTVTIAPGTIIKFAHSSSLVVNASGNLVADAGFGAAIIFTSMDDNTVGDTIYGSDAIPEVGDWNKIVLTTTYAYLEHVEIYYGGEQSGYNSNASLMIYADTTLIRNCTVGYSDYNGIELHGNAKLFNCNVFACDAFGVKTDIEITDYYDFDECNFHNNGYGLNISVYAGDVSVTNCDFEFNDNYGLNVSGSHSSIGADINTHCTINDCNFSNNGDEAVYLDNVTILSEFTNNTASNNGLDAFYIRSAGDNDTLNLYYCNGIPFVVGEYFSVNALLNIYEGTVIKIVDDAIGVSANATLNILGTEANPVIFTSINDDSIGGDTGNDGTTNPPTVKSALNSNAICNIEYTKFYYSTASINNNAHIKNSLFDGGTSGSTLYGKVTLDSCIFTNNNIGFSSYYDTSYVNNCTFENNTTGLLNSTNVVVRNSIFSGNQYGVRNSGYYTDLGKNSTDSIGNNIFTNNSSYDIYNQSDDVIYAIMNTWDSEIPSVIDSKLYDDNEDPDNGEVIFTPWYTDCTFSELSKPIGDTLMCKNIVVNFYSTINDDDSASVVWNIEPDTAGTIDASGNTATITWNQNYVGMVNLWVYPEKDCGHGNNTDTLIMQRVALPEIPIISQTNYSLTSTEATTYQWYKFIIGGNYYEPINGETEQSFTPTENGTYAVEIGNEAECAVFSENFVFTLSSVNDIQINSIKIFPNPVKDKITVINNNNSDYTITIFNITGQLIKEIQTNKNVTTFDLDTKAGVYIVKISNSKFQTKILNIFVE